MYVLQNTQLKQQLRESFKLSESVIDINDGLKDKNTLLQNELSVK